MSIPQEIVIDDETIWQRLDSIATYNGSDDDQMLLSLAGFDIDSFRQFASETGKTVDPLVEKIFAMGSPVVQKAQSAWTWQSLGQ